MDVLEAVSKGKDICQWKEFIREHCEQKEMTHSHPLGPIVPMICFKRGLGEPFFI